MRLFTAIYADGAKLELRASVADMALTHAKADMANNNFADFYFVGGAQVSFAEYYAACQEYAELLQSRTAMYCLEKAHVTDIRNFAHCSGMSLMG